MSFARNMRSVLVVAVILGLLVGAVSLLLRRQSNLQNTASAPTQSLGFGLQVGHSYSYLLRYDTLQKAAAGLGNEEGLGGAMQLEADLTLYVHEAREGQFSLSATLDHIQHAKLKLADQFLWQNKQDALRTFAGRRMFFRMDASGKIASLTPPAGDDADTKLFSHTMQTLLTELQVQLALDGARDYVREESTLFGRVESHYTQKTTQELVRTRERATFLRAASLGTAEVTHELRAEHLVKLNRERVIEQLEGKEELTVQAEQKDLQRVSTRLSLTLRSRARFDPLQVAFAGGAQRALDAWGAGEDSERDHLDQRIDGLTVEQLLETVIAMGAGAERTDQARFLWRATGLLIRDPALCMKLVPLATHDKASRELRALTLDLLTGVSDEAATQAMLAILTAAPVRSDEAYPVYLQRLGAQTAPNDEAFELVHEVFAEAQRAGQQDELFASAYTLGSMAQEAEGGSPQERRAVSALRESLAQVDDPTAVAHHVRALGNVGRDSVLSDVQRLRNHEDSEVRTAVATALGAIPSAQAERDLLELVGDASPSVQREAILSLYRRKVGPEGLLELRRSIQGGVAEANVPYLLDVLKRLRKQDPQGVAETLDTLIASGSLTREQRSLVDALRDG